MNTDLSACCAVVELRSERVLLHPQRALLWPARRTIIIADPHFGKDDIFRRAGIALPQGPAINDLQRLSALIEATKYDRLVVLGDFLHGATRRGDSFPHAFQVWRREHARLEIDIIAGNHDRREAVDKWRGVARWHAEVLEEEPFVLAHQPMVIKDQQVLSGHIHPVIKLARASGAGRVPVFWLKPGCLILPSFGSFTGGAHIRPEAGDRLFAAGTARVVQLIVPPAASRVIVGP